MDFYFQSVYSMYLNNVLFCHRSGDQKHDDEKALKKPCGNRQYSREVLFPTLITAEPNTIHYIAFFFFFFKK